ncbi:hypothetical protein BZG36_01080 [Bifiguratus adelaidae]|uniref:Glycosyl transferase family 25 domain-containing protein n=1 Tax=Bifiguratus adelaidae TaxID=1938954 RepID=A0A261Y647_9FUNG|nr:hypothetical protein BZG36_01080 [Bifiguratus adelaidae]
MEMEHPLEDEYDPEHLLSLSLPTFSSSIEPASKPNVPLKLTKQEYVKQNDLRPPTFKGRIPPGYVMSEDYWSKLERGVRAEWAIQEEEEAARLEEQEALAAQADDTDGKPNPTKKKGPKKVAVQKDVKPKKSPVEDNEKQDKKQKADDASSKENAAKPNTGDESSSESLIDDSEHAAGTDNVDQEQIDVQAGGTLSPLKATKDAAEMDYKDPSIILPSNDISLGSEKDLFTDHIYVINLPRRNDRRLIMDEVADLLDIDIDYFKATDMTGLEGKVSDEMRLEHPAQAACYQSYVEVWKDVVKHDYASVVVLEDDADPARDIKHYAQKSLQMAPKDWDIIFIGHCSNREWEQWPISKKFDQLRPSTAPLCTHGYMLSQAGARKLIEKIGVVQWAVDEMIIQLVYARAINAFSLWPTRIGQHRKADNADSDINVGIPALEPVANSAVEHLRSLGELTDDLFLSP